MRQDDDLRPLPPQIGDCAQQQVQPLIGIERAEESEDSFPAKAEARHEERSRGRSAR